ncbi:MAG: HD domain-containing protein [Clostridiales bacterium]|nr:HD domain-containing protein [Clostridiales bacterium]
MKQTLSNRKILRNRLRAFICLALVFVLLSGNISAADDGGEQLTSGGHDVASDVEKGQEDYSAVLYDNKNGLPTSEANAIAETDEGFIWIGAYSGLIKYDGKTFERIDSTTGISSVVSLYADSKNRLWIGTNDSGVAVMEKDEVRFYRKDDGMPSLSVRSITEDPDGNIFVATTEGLVYIDGNMDLHPMESPELREEFMYEVRTGKDGTVYGITQKDGIFTIRDQKLTGYFYADNYGIKSIKTVTPDDNESGCIYVGDEKSNVYHVRIRDGEMTVIEDIVVYPLDYINSIQVIGDMLWICADNGIGIVQDGKVNILDKLPLLYSVDNQMMDYEGNLWFTSSRQGVMKIVPNQFMDYSGKYDLPDTVVNTTCLYGDMMLIGSDSGLTVIKDDKPTQRVPLKTCTSASGDYMRRSDLVTMLTGTRIRSITKDNDGNCWIATYSDFGLIRYDGVSAVCFRDEDGMPSDRIRTVYPRKDGTVMAACRGGLAIIEGDSVTGVYNEADGIINTEILSVAEAPNGDMVIGSDGGGIYVLRDGKTFHIGTESGLGSDIVMRIKYDPGRNIFWIVTSNSIAYMDTDYDITTISKFPYSNNFDLYENSQGEMWIISSNGIYVARVEDLLKNETIQTVYYGIENGLPCMATANAYSELTSDGTLYLAGSTGVCRVNIDRPFESVDDIKLAVPYIDADDVRYYPDEKGRITIPSDVKKITVYGYVFNYTLMDPQVTFYLEGFDKGSTKTVKRSMLEPIDYTNLSGGKYTFVMKISDSSGNGNKEIRIEIVKEKAFFEKVWFWVLTIAAFMALAGFIVFLWFRKKTKALIRKEQQNRALIREITEAFAKTIDMKDKYTNGHSKRVAEYTVMLAREMGCDDETIEKFYNIALLHDIGKIGVPPEVLNKPGKLTDEEFRIIKSHSALGKRVLKDISIMPELAIGAGLHHERPDGKGYPNGLKGDEIPDVAKIIAVADTFDAMYSDRPYRKRMNFDKAVSIIKEVSGTQLASEVVDAFLRLVEKGEFRAPDDQGGGSMDDIDNIHKKQNEDSGKDTKDG